MAKPLGHLTDTVPVVEQGRGEQMPHLMRPLVDRHSRYVHLVPYRTGTTRAAVRDALIPLLRQLP